MSKTKIDFFISLYQEGEWGIFKPDKNGNCPRNKRPIDKDTDLFALIRRIPKRKTSLVEFSEAAERRMEQLI